MTRPAFAAAHPTTLVLRTLALLLPGALCACQPPGASPANADKPVELKIRPRPQQAYRIVMTIENAPGPFGLIEGSAQYDVVNYHECGKINRVAGVASRVTTNPPIQWEKLSDTEYAATVYADLMVDEDYYGRGLCRWTFTQVRARLKATGADSETRFVPGITPDDIQKGNSLTWYFWKGGYPIDLPLHSNGAGYVDFGYTSPGKFRPEIRDQLFRITFEATTAQP